MKRTALTVLAAVIIAILLPAATVVTAAEHLRAALRSLWRNADQVARNWERQR